MSTLTTARTEGLSLHSLSTAIRNVEGRVNENEIIDLEAQGFQRLDGDNRWRVILCTRGKIWITQECDVRDYVLEAGDMFIVSQPGSVLIEGLGDASVQITPSLKRKPYRGDYPIFH